MPPASRHPAFLGLVIAACLLAACGKSTESRFYTLTPMPGADTPAGPEAGPCLALGVGPVDLPSYLERPQIVTRPGGNRFDLAEYDRWAEPLQDTVHRTLAENLAEQVCAAPLVFYPWPSGTQVDCQVVVQILRMETTSSPAGGEAILKANWWLQDAEGRRLDWQSASYRRKAGDESYGAFAAAQSLLLEDLSRDIARAVTGQCGRNHRARADGTAQEAPSRNPRE